MQKDSKKGLSSHISILAITSFAISILLFSILSLTYGNEHQDCRLIDYEIKNECKDVKKASFDIVNNLDRISSFKVGSDIYQVGPGESKSVSQVFRDNPKIEILPVIERGRIYECRGKIKKINTEVLIKC